MLSMLMRGLAEVSLYNNFLADMFNFTNNGFRLDVEHLMSR